MRKPIEMRQLTDAEEYALRDATAKRAEVLDAKKRKYINTAVFLFLAFLAIVATWLTLSIIGYLLSLLKGV